MTNPDKKLTEERLAEIEARANAASPGPWVREPGSWQPITDANGEWVVADDGVSKSAADEDFITHSRADVADLVGEVRRLRSLFKSHHVEWLETGEVTVSRPRREAE